MGINLETVFGIVIILIGIVSLGLTINARGALQESGELKTIIDRLIYVIAFLTCYSVLHVVREVFHLKKTFGDVIEYPEYLFISLTYIMILRTAGTLHNIVNMLGKLGVSKK